MKKGCKQLSVLVAVMLLIAVFSIPASAYGEMKKHISDSSSNYYVSATGEQKEYYTIGIGESLQLNLYDSISHSKVDTVQAGWHWGSQNWHGRDNSIVSVDYNTGVVQGKSSGKAIVSVFDGNGQEFFATIYAGDYKEKIVKVDNKQRTRNPFSSQEGYQFEVGETAQLKVFEGEEEISLNDLTWKTQCQDAGGKEIEGVISISQSGEIQALKRGSAYIKVGGPGWDNGSNVTIFVGSGCDYGIKGDKKEIAIGGIATLKLTAFPEEVINSGEWEWSSTNANIAAVDQSGIVEGIATGAAQIKVRNLDGSIVRYYDVNVKGASVYHDFATHYEYTLNEKQKTAKAVWFGGTGEKSIQIPSMVEVKTDNQYKNWFTPGKYLITSLGKGAINSKGADSVVIPDTITEIADYAVGYENAPGEYHVDPDYKISDFTVYGYAQTSAAAKYATDNGFAFVDLEKQSDEIINGNNAFTKTYGSKSFSLGAKAFDGERLGYHSSNEKIAEVSDTGKVDINGVGSAVITIAAEKDNFYNPQTKKVTINVAPQKVAALSLKAGSKYMSVSWRKDNRASGYQIVHSINRTFSKAKKQITITKNTSTKQTVKNLKRGKTYYVKVRAYKKTGGVTLYGPYSDVKSVKIK